jgi:hypothetical protein
LSLFGICLGGGDYGSSATLWQSLFSYYGDIFWSN